MNRNRVTLLALLITCVFIALQGSSDTGDSSMGNPVSAVNEEITIPFDFGVKTGRFSGTLMNGLPTGYGEFSTESSDGTAWTYYGEFKEGHFDTGLTTFSDGVTLEGRHYKDELIEGKMYYDGYLFEGAFVDEQPSEGKVYYG